MADEGDAEQDYDAESDYYVDEDLESEDIDEEESESEKEDEEQVDIEFLEEEKEKKETFVRKINELDRNHIIVKIIPKHLRRSSHILQYPEMVEVIGARASQIERGCIPFTNVAGLSNPIDMAKKEFIDRKNPFIIERIMRTEEDYVEIEEWEIREMTYPITDREILNTPSVAT